MDVFHEEVCARGPLKGLPFALYIVSWGISVIVGVIALLQVYVLLNNFTVADLLLALGFLAVIGATFLYRELSAVDYEYSLTNGDLEFARIINNKKRRDDFTVNLTNIIAAGFARNAKFGDLDKMPGIKRHNFFLRADTPHYFLCFRDASERPHMVVYEPSQELEKLVRQLVPHGQYYA